MPSLVLDIKVNDQGTPKVRTFQQVVGGSRGPMDRFDAGTKNMSNGLTQVSVKAGSAMSSIRNFTGALLAASGIESGLQGIVEQGKKLVETSMAFQRVDNTLKAVFGTTQAAANEFKFVSDESMRLGLNLVNASTSYAQLAAAAKDTATSGQTVRDTFSALSEASTVLGMDAQRAELSLFAITQMMSKGRVASEELRRQLGDNLPGAFNIAARAMGVTTAELDKMMKNGDLATADFLPKFAAELRKTFGGALGEATQSTQANINRFQTLLAQVRDKLADSGPIDAFVGGMNEIRESMAAALKDGTELEAWGKRIGGVIEGAFKTAGVGMKVGGAVAPYIDDAAVVAAAAVFGKLTMAISLKTATTVRDIAVEHRSVELAREKAIATMEELRAVVAMNEVTLQNTQANLANAQSRKAQVAAQRSVNVATKELAVSQAALTASQKAATASTVAGSLAMKGLNSLWNLVGGGIGVVTIALGLYYLKWEKVTRVIRDHNDALKASIDATNREAAALSRDPETGKVKKLDSGDSELKAKRDQFIKYQNELRSAARDIRVYEERYNDSIMKSFNPFLKAKLYNDIQEAKDRYVELNVAVRQQSLILEDYKKQLAETAAAHGRVGDSAKEMSDETRKALDGMTASAQDTLTKLQLKLSGRENLIPYMELSDTISAAIKKAEESGDTAGANALRVMAPQLMAWKKEELELTAGIDKRKEAMDAAKKATEDLRREQERLLEEFSKEVPQLPYEVANQRKRDLGIELTSDILGKIGNLKSIMPFLDARELEQAKKMLAELNAQLGVSVDYQKAFADAGIRTAAAIQKEVETYRALADQARAKGDSISASLADQKAGLLAEEYRELTDGTYKLRDAGLMLAPSLDTQIAKLQALEPLARKNAAAYAEWQARMNDLQRQADLQSGDPLRGMKVGFEDYMRNLEDISGFTANKTREVFDSMESSLGNAFYKMMAEGASFKDAMQGFFQEMGQTFMKIIAEMIARLIIFGSIQAAMGLASGNPFSMLGSMFSSGAPVQTGGIPGNSPAAPSAPARNRSNSDESPIVIYNMIAPETVAQAMNSQAGHRTIINAVTADSARSGPVRRTIRSER